MVEIYQKKSCKELVVTELALNFSVWKSSPAANACVLDSPAFLVELLTAGGSSSVLLWET